MANVRIYKQDRFSYGIEDRAFPNGRTFETIEQVREYAQAVVKSDWWNERCALTQISVLSTKSRKISYSESNKAAISLSGYHWHESIILHELCHQFTDSRHGYSRHNEKFMYWLYRFNKEFNSYFNGTTTTFSAMHDAWARADGLYLEAGINVGVEDPAIELENKGRVKLAPPEIGPVYQGRAPEGYVRMREVSYLVDRLGKSMSAFVNACGGDKNTKEPKAEYWRVVYAAGVKWLPKEAADHVSELPAKRSAR